MAIDNVLVKFIDQVSKEVRWLPTFEKGGYLDMVKQLVPDSSPDKQITMKDSATFQERFAEIQERSPLGGIFVLAIGCPCPECGSRNQTLEKECVLDRPSLKWMRYVAQGE